MQRIRVFGDNALYKSTFYLLFLLTYLLPSPTHNSDIVGSPVSRITQNIIDGF